MSKILTSELKRLLALQQELDPSTEAYRTLLGNLEFLVYNAELYEVVEQIVDGGIVKIEFRPPVPPREIPTTPFPPDNVTPFPEKVETGTAEPVEPDVPKQETGADMGQEHKTYDMTEVRAALVEARKKGVNVTDLLHEFGVDNFGAFPAGRYGELMERLES